MFCVFVFSCFTLIHLHTIQCNIVASNFTLIDFNKLFTFDTNTAYYVMSSDQLLHAPHISLLFTCLETLPSIGRRGQRRSDPSASAESLCPVWGLFSLFIFICYVFLSSPSSPWLLCPHDTHSQRWPFIRGNALFLIQFSVFSLSGWWISFLI